MSTLSEIIVQINELNDYQAVRDYLSEVYLITKTGGKAPALLNEISENGLRFHHIVVACGDEDLLNNVLSDFNAYNIQIQTAYTSETISQEVLLLNTANHFTKVNTPKTANRSKYLNYLSQKVVNDQFAHAKQQLDELLSTLRTELLLSLPKPVELSEEIVKNFNAMLKEIANVFNALPKGETKSQYEEKICNTLLTKTSRYSSKFSGQAFLHIFQLSSWEFFLETLLSFDFSKKGFYTLFSKNVKNDERIFTLFIGMVDLENALFVKIIERLKGEYLLILCSEEIIWCYNHNPISYSSIHNAQNLASLLHAIPPEQRLNFITMKTSGEGNNPTSLRNAFTAAASLNPNSLVVISKYISPKEYAKLCHSYLGALLSIKKSEWENGATIEAIYEITGHFSQIQLYPGYTPEKMAQVFEKYFSDYYLPDYSAHLITEYLGLTQENQLSLLNVLKIKIDTNENKKISALCTMVITQLQKQDSKADAANVQGIRDLTDFVFQNLEEMNEAVFGAGLAKVIDARKTRHASLTFGFGIYDKSLVKNIFFAEIEAYAVAHFGYAPQNAESTTTFSKVITSNIARSAGKVDVTVAQTESKKINPWLSVYQFIAAELNLEPRESISKNPKTLYSDNTLQEAFTTYVKDRLDRKGQPGADFGHVLMLQKNRPHQYPPNSRKPLSSWSDKKEKMLYDLIDDIYKASKEEFDDFVQFISALAGRSNPAVEHKPSAGACPSENEGVRLPASNERVQGFVKAIEPTIKEYAKAIRSDDRGNIQEGSAASKFDSSLRL